MTTHECLHEDLLQDQSTKIAELEAKNGFKEQRINELIEDNRRIESKIDNLTDTVNKVMLNSIKDDSDLKEEVLVLKTKIDTQDKLIDKFKEEARKSREDERAKTNQHLRYITIGLTIFFSALSYILK